MVAKGSRWSVLRLVHRRDRRSALVGGPQVRHYAGSRRMAQCMLRENFPTGTADNAPAPHERAQHSCRWWGL